MTTVYVYGAIYDQSNEYYVTGDQTPDTGTAVNASGRPINTIPSGGSDYFYINNVEYEYIGGANQNGIRNGTEEGIIAFVVGATEVTPVFITTQPLGSGEYEFYDNSGDSPYAVCFMAGTAIETPAGRKRIEELKVGDVALTADGREALIKWIGYQKVATRFGDPRWVMPVCIHASALAENLPRRDLWVSPGHSLAVDGRLIQAGRLVNGATIEQVPVRRVEYWHVELDKHDIILAEGVAAESYLDTGNRTAFLNRGSFVELYSDLEPRHWTNTCLPFADEPALHLTKVALLNRAISLGYSLTADADAHLMADGRRIEPKYQDESRLEFELPEDSSVLELRCRTFVPAHTVASSDDVRPLGLCVSGLSVDDISWDLADETVFAQGWHELELHGQKPQRWSQPSVPLPPGARRMTIQLCGAGRYWAVPERALQKCG